MSRTRTKSQRQRLPSRWRRKTSFVVVVIVALLTIYGTLV
ncbi:AmpE protein [Enterobacter hormaechei]|nr:AmpE protein [Enterobacter hormaechei]